MITHSMIARLSAEHLIAIFNERYGLDCIPIWGDEPGRTFDIGFELNGKLYAWAILPNVLRSICSDSELFDVFLEMMKERQGMYI